LGFLNPELLFSSNQNGSEVKWEILGTVGEILAVTVTKLVIKSGIQLN
jgi:hypothetical protein